MVMAKASHKPNAEAEIEQGNSATTGEAPPLDVIAIQLKQAARRADFR
jgi:hypothetical protein